MTAICTASLLVELLTEELPPKALKNLGETFAQTLAENLRQAHLLSDESVVTPLTTPRRLAVHISQVKSQAPEQPFTEKLMPTKVGLDETGQATPALLKKLAAKGLAHLSVDQLQTIDDGKQPYLIATGTAEGIALTQAMNGALSAAIHALPIPKVMRYQLADGHTTVSFVRPAHGLVVLHGDQLIDAQILGLSSRRETDGHRFLTQTPVTLTAADNYETELSEQGRVTASFALRRASIEAGLVTKAAELGATLGEDAAVDALLDEVTALVEAPAVYVGAFESRFLAVPQECLILTMRLNQKYFPLFDLQTGHLTHHFLIVSNMPISDPSAIITGNERVIRPRLADAEFFYLTDKRKPLIDRLPALENIVYHNKLGTQRVRIERIRQITQWIATALGVDGSESDRAALLAKADLPTQMVGEFPELQGVMGSYYARADGESTGVVNAIKHQYQIRWLQTAQPEHLAGLILFMAERAETLVGIWGIGLAPTGERDPYGLRRAALGLISGFERWQAGGQLPLSGKHPLTLETLLQAARDTFDDSLGLAETTVEDVSRFVRERYRNQLLGQQSREAVDAVLALEPALQQITARIQAVQAFMQTPEAPSLAAANKRIANLLKKNNAQATQLDISALSDDAEKKLWGQVQAISPVVEQHMAQAQFEAALNTLATLKEPVDRFFDEVMVMAEDPLVRQQRLCLLAHLHRLMNQVADISRLAT